MSTLSNIFHDFTSLLFPSQCIACGAVIDGRNDWICLRCRIDIPLTYFHHEVENPMAVKIKALHPFVVNAAAQYFYINNGRWREVIHQIKYRNAWRSAYKLGYIYGVELLESPLYQDIDVVIPVPLHPLRTLKRHYNQSEKIAGGIARAMEIAVDWRSLRRRHYNQSQTTRTKSERWNNVQNIFTVRRADKLAGKHILLVDDVFTTGATISACIDALQAAVPTCRISVATLAVSRYGVFGNIN